MSGFDALLFSPEFPEGRIPGRLHFDGEPVFRSEDGNWNYPPAQLQLRLGGADHDMVYLEIPGKPVVCVRSLAVLDELSVYSDLRDQIARLRAGKKAKSRWKFFGVALLLVFIIGVPAFFFGYGTSLLVGMLPRSLDRKIGEAALPAVLQQMGAGKAIRDKKLLEPMEKLVARMVREADHRDFDFKVHIVSSEMTNAFALPGGNIVILTGLLRSATNAEEVAGVLAHEISHVTGRHGMRQVVRAVGTTLLLQLVLGDAGALAETLGTTAADLAGLGFSRGMESDADEQGFSLLVKSGIDPAGLIRFFEIIAKEKTANPPAWLSTHPLTEERIRELKKAREKLGKKRFDPVRIPWKSYQQELEKSAKKK